ncbi:MAG: AbrB family transcriptional regulator [Anaerolineae bacterium]|nr:AbrB family transcriptional regulator [Anaerolineae bacterium]
MATEEYLRALTSKGQVTVPKEIRDRLNLGPGVLVRFRTDAEGNVTISRAAPSLEAGYGAVSPRSRPEDFQRLHDEAVEERIASKFGGKDEERMPCA